MKVKKIIIAFCPAVLPVFPYSQEIYPSFMNFTNFYLAKCRAPRYNRANERNVPQTLRGKGRHHGRKGYRYSGALHGAAEPPHSGGIRHRRRVLPRRGQEGPAQQRWHRRAGGRHQGGQRAGLFAAGRPAGAYPRTAVLPGYRAQRHRGGSPQGRHLRL